jgi:quercetin dioxygenase-like cupin family protein
MRYRASWLAVALTLAVCVAPAAAQQPAMAKDGPMMVSLTDSLKWSPIMPPGFEKGVEMAVVSGDPSAAGEPYVLRLRFPANYRFPAHWHPVAENVTVLEGRFLVAMGERPDDSQLKTYRPGDFMKLEAKHPHYGGARGATTIQLHGNGPFEIVVVGSPQDKR